MHIKTFFVVAFLTLTAAHARSYPLSTPQIGAKNKDEGMTIERYKLIGASKDGFKIAVLLSHFGYSSRAPFANLIVKDQGNTATEIVDSAFSFAGGEKDLVTIGEALVEKNTSKLKERGIIIDTNAAESVPYFYEYEDNVMKGVIDLKHDGFTNKFSIKLVADSSCTEGHNWKLCFLEECLVVSHQYSCSTENFMMQNIYTIGSYLWFFGQRKVRVFDGAVTMVDFAGIKIQ